MIDLKSGRSRKLKVSFRKVKQPSNTFYPSGLPRIVWKYLLGIIPFENGI